MQHEAGTVDSMEAEYVSAADNVLTQPDLLGAILSWLSPAELLDCARTCCAFRLEVDALLTQDGVLELKEGDGVEEVTDGLLLFLAKQRLPGTIRKMDVAGCSALSKTAIWRAARFSPCLKELIATKVGGASWTLLEVQRLIEACPSLRYLHIDCKSKGVSQDLIDMLQHPALAVEKLTLHRSATNAATAADTPPAPTTPPTPSLAVGTGGEVIGGEGASPSAPDVFGSSLRRCPSLKELDAGGDVLEAVDGVFQISRALASADSNLQRLIMPSVPSMRRDVGVLAEGLASNSKLESLELGCNFIGATGAEQLASALAGHPTLRSLELPHNPLLGGAVALGDALVHNRSLTNLSVPFTGLGDEACDALARALCGGSTVRILDLSGNRLTGAGAAVLASGLAHPDKPNRALTSLNLTANHKIGAEGALAIGAALRGCALRVLSLAGCGIGHAPCGRLVASLRGSAVETLDLSSNEIKDEGTWELAWGLPGCAVRDLRLAVNEIEDDGATELLSALQAGAPLDSLDLRGNRILTDPGTSGALLAARPGVNLRWQNHPRAD